VDPSIVSGWTSGRTTNYGLGVYGARQDGSWKSFASLNTPNPPFLQITYQADTAPSLTSMMPPSGERMDTLTPELTAGAVDPDNFPGKGLQFEFRTYRVVNGVATMTADSGTLAKGGWSVPSGALTWEGDNYWQARVSDTLGWSPWSDPSYFGLTVQQPPITSGLGSVNGGPGYDALTGNYTAQVTDAAVPVVGPPLSIQRTYNSADPRVGQAFGAGWSTVLDSSAVLADDGTGDLVVTYASGQQTRFGRNADGSFAPPAGTYATITAASTTVPSGSYCPAVSTGFCLLDKTRTTYAFTVPETSSASASGPWLLSQVTDPQGHATLFGYTAVSGAEQPTSMQSCVSACQGASPPVSRSLAFTWSTAAQIGGGAAFPHVTTVSTGPVSGTDASTDLSWTYTYTGDRLSAMCDPTEQAAGCAQEARYGYQAGSQFSDGVLDSGPSEYWRLGDAAGATGAADQEPANEGTENAVPTGVAFGVSAAAAGPNGLAHGPLGTGATVASFNGSSSMLALPSNLVTSKTFLTIGLWFETTSAGILFAEQDQPMGSATTPSHATASLYVGTDGKLHGAWYAGGITAANQAISSAGVTDGQWHYAVLAAAGTTQTLFLDGQKACSSCTVSGQINNEDQSDVYVGAGYWSGVWPNQPSAGSDHFSGEISDIAFYPGSMGATAVAQLYAAAKQPSALLNSIAKPSGAVQDQVQYDTAADRVTSVTDADGGSYTVQAPTVTGSSDVFAGSVLGAQPAGYWRFGPPLSTVPSGVADNEVTAHTATVTRSGCLPSSGVCGVLISGFADPSGDGSYNDVTIGASGSSPFSDTTGGVFDGSTSYVQLPANELPSTGATAIGLWFKTSTPTGMLFGGQSTPLGATVGGELPDLYVGSDGLLHGAFWHHGSDGSQIMASPAAVTDGKWHYTVLSTNGEYQYLYLDGRQVAAQSLTGLSALDSFAYEYVGAGTAGTGWPALPNLATAYFKGDISDVAVYDHGLAGSQVAQQYADLKSSTGLTPEVSVSVTNPAGASLVSTYDPREGGRLLSSTDADGGTTRYGYDTGGFLNTVTDPLGDVTTTGHDVRGNELSQTTCQNLAAQQCSTSYYTYWPDDSSPSLSPNPLDDVKTSQRDGRSASASDPAYMTQYSYDSYGDLTATSDPLGRTTANTYSNGTQAAVAAPASATAPAACSAASATSGTIPVGLVLTKKTPGGSVTSYRYYADGDLAVQTSPLGQTTIYVYDGAGRVLFKTQCSDTFPNGTVTAYTYDGDGRALTETDPATVDAVTGAAHQKQIASAYTVDGQVQTSTVSDVGGSAAPDASRVTTSGYYPSGLLQTVTDPTGAKTQYAYNAEGEKTGETDPNGDVLAYGYDGDGNVTSTTLMNYQGTSSGVCQPAPGQLVTDSKAYDLVGRLARETDAMCRQTAYTYFDDGLTATVTQDAPAGGTSPNVTESKTYDGAGEVLSDSTGNGEAVALTSYDAAGQATLHRTLYAQNASGAPQYKYTRDTYNLDGDVASTAKWQDDSSGTVETTDYTYDAAGDKLTEAVHQSTQAQTESSVGLDGQWGLADGKTTTAADGSGAGHPATLSGDAGWSGNAPPGLKGSLATDGSTGSAATSGGVLKTNAGFSVSAWVYLTDSSGTDTAVAQAGSVNAAFYLQYSAADGKWAFSMVSADSAGPTPYRALSNSAPALNTWTHLTGVYTAGTGLLQLYVNGALQSTTATDTQPFASSGPLLIGHSKYNSTPADWWHGDIAGVQAYSRSLSGDEAAQLYNNQSLGSQGLAGSWQLNDGAAAAAADASAGNRPAAASGGVVWSAANGGSAEFNGTNGSLATAAPAVNTGAGFSVGAWVDLTSTSGYNTAVAQAGKVASGFYLQFNPGTKKWAFAANASDTAAPASFAAQSNATAATGTWTYLTGVYTAGTGLLQLYVNGALQSTTATDATEFATSGPLLIGRSQYNSAPADWWHGAISGVSAYGQALTGAQVAALYSSGTLAAAPMLATTSWTYDRRGAVTSQTDPLGNTGAAPSGYTATYTSDQLGRVTQVALPPIVTTVGGVASASATSPVTLTGYDTYGDAVESQDPNGYITAATYDADGRALKSTQPSYTQHGTGTYNATFLATTANAYNPDGTLQSVTDPAGNVTSYTYDQFRDQTSQTNPAITVTSGGTTASKAGQTLEAYDQDGELIQATDPSGAVTQSQYNYLGQMTQVTSQVRQPAASTDTTLYGYDVLGNLISRQAQNQNAATFGYDDAGEQTSSTDPAGQKTSYTYDLDGRVTGMFNPDGTWTWNGYDLDGNLTYTADFTAANGSTPARSRSFGYDLNGEQTWAGDEMGHSTSFGYNQDGEQIAQWEPVGSSTGVNTAYGYDAAGNRTSYTDGDNNTTVTTYNSWGLPDSTIVPATSTYSAAADRTTANVYDLDGNLVQELEPGGVVLTDGYDALGDLTAQNGSGATASTDARAFGYDLDGRQTLAATVNASGATDTSDTFTYDDLGNLLSTAGTSGTSSFTYDQAGRMTARTDAAGTTDYGYNTAGELSTVQDPLTGVTGTYAYNAMGAPSSITYGSGDVRKFGYDALDRLSSDQILTAPGAGQTQVAAIDYQYDNNDNETAQTTYGLGGGSPTSGAANAYTYDYAGRLTSWTGATGVTTKYGYDGAGNRTSIAHGTTSTAYTYNALDQLTNDGTNAYTYAADGTLAKVTPNAGGAAQTYSYDAYQEMTGLGGTSYTYDALARATQVGASQLLYSGPGNNEVSDGTATYALDPTGAIVADRTAASGSTLTMTDAHDNLVAQFAPAASALSASQTYDPLGAVTSTANWSAAAGYQSEFTSNGQVDMAARWYAPATGQFDSADTQQNSPTPASVNANPYAYAGDDPMTQVDPSGHRFCVLIIGPDGADYECFGKDNTPKFDKVDLGPLGGDRWESEDLGPLNRPGPAPAPPGGGDGGNTQKPAPPPPPPPWWLTHRTPGAPTCTGIDGIVCVSSPQPNLKPIVGGPSFNPTLAPPETSANGDTCITTEFAGPQGPVEAPTTEAPPDDGNAPSDEPTSDEPDGQDEQDQQGDGGCEPAADPSGSTANVKPNCEAADTEGNVTYGPTVPFKNGDGKWAPLCRATGVSGSVTLNRTYSRTIAGRKCSDCDVNRAMRQRMEDLATLSECNAANGNLGSGHLLPYALGGRGKDQRNLTPQCTQANEYSASRGPEAKMRDLINKDKVGTVYFDIRPVYDSDYGGVPVAYTYKIWWYVEGKKKSVSCWVANINVKVGGLCR
jgi:RHS repeat-associated protein